ncbi:leucine-rich repeat protein [Perkinsela sp. CCAP 1560/4]|nr:leucine-rich repeat protein [Perkinsela sp. CCAP 1560/4]|eukprot:KNH05786.1 leucine-rich repeat protein [Perkinsela sp. CCAP 1560/4]
MIHCLNEFNACAKVEALPMKVLHQVYNGFNPWYPQRTVQRFWQWLARIQERRGLNTLHLFGEAAQVHKSEVLRIVIEPRFLPRQLASPTIQSCGLIGSLDISAMPPLISEIVVRNNLLSGTLRLSNLPPNLTILDASHNCIKKVIVDNSSIPCGFHKAIFHGNIPKLRLITLNGEKVDDRIYLDYNDIKENSKV